MCIRLTGDGRARKWYLRADLRADLRALTGDLRATFQAADQHVYALTGTYGLLRALRAGLTGVVSPTFREGTAMPVTRKPHRKRKRMRAGTGGQAGQAGQAQERGCVPV